MVDLLPVNPEIVDLLSKVKKEGLLIAAASNSLHVSIVKMLEATGLISFVDVIVGNDDVPNPKPAPDVYLQAAKLLGVPMEECTIVEDSPVGIEAAIAAFPYKICMVQDVQATATLEVEDLV
jgi:HAD superfamily hydrolase (TIGR01509 family)